MSGGSQWASTWEATPSNFFLGFFVSVFLLCFSTWFSNFVKELGLLTNMDQWIRGLDDVNPIYIYCKQ
jgi:hypothetical protein